MRIYHNFNYFLIDGHLDDVHYFAVIKTLLHILKETKWNGLVEKYVLLQFFKNWFKKYSLKFKLLVFYLRFSQLDSSVRMLWFV